jgi:serine phosphatase RsbU (regulator of sigma subunit)
MATTCAMIRTAASGKASPGEVLALVNDLLQVHIPSGTFATCFYAILDPASGRLRYANAGHNLPYLSRSGEIIELRAVGMPLGLMPEQGYAEEEIILAIGDRILFYSDGLVEAHGADGQMFGGPRLKRLLQGYAEAGGLIAGGLVEYLLGELRSFTGADWEQEDDVTLVVVRKKV